MDELDRVAAVVLRRAGSETPRSWGVGQRAERVYAVVQALADLAAAADARPPRIVPRLADTVLSDQLAVMVADLGRAPPAVRGAAAALLSAL